MIHHFDYLTWHGCHFLHTSSIIYCEKITIKLREHAHLEMIRQAYLDRFKDETPKRGITKNSEGRDVMMFNSREEAKDFFQDRAGKGNIFFAYNRSDTEGCMFSPGNNKLYDGSPKQIRDKIEADTELKPEHKKLCIEKLNKLTKACGNEKAQAPSASTSTPTPSSLSQGLLEENSSRNRPFSGSL
jgi:hypothetical protein